MKRAEKSLLSPKKSTAKATSTPFFCPTCSRTFTTSGYLEKHVRMTHRLSYGNVGASRQVTSSPTAPVPVPIAASLASEPVDNDSDSFMDAIPFEFVDDDNNVGTVAEATKVLQQILIFLSFPFSPSSFQRSVL